MTFIFWQGIISIHQKAFLEAVAMQPSVSKVLLVVEHEITPYRKNMGWDAPDIANVEIIKHPMPHEIQSIVRAHKDAVHIMGGIRVGHMIPQAFDACVQQGASIGIMTEPYNAAGFKGWLRTQKYKRYRRKYFKHIRFVLTIGRQGLQQYTDLGFDRGSIFPWAYFISADNVAPKLRQQEEQRRIIYAGRLEEGKGIYRFIEELINTGSRNFIMDIYGSGYDEDKIKELVAARGLEYKISFYPFLRYTDLAAKYTSYDWVVLPSTAKDGWGVIISEGLLNGLRAICSTICGVSWVVQNGVNGVAFDWNKEGSCREAIATMLDNNDFAAPEAIRSWAQDTISGVAGAAYFMQIMDSVYNGKERPGIPWERKV